MPIFSTRRAGRRRFALPPVLLAFAAFGLPEASAQGQTLTPSDPPKQVLFGGSPRIYIAPQEAFGSYVAAAIVKKHVPAVVTQDKEEAQFSLTSAVDAKTESTGSIVARCLFLYCAGAAGSQTATVQLVNLKTHEVVWAYNVNKASARAYQSSAEAIAKHLKKFLEEHPR